MVRAREWTGFEAAALQEAMRKSIREYAALLGVETTTVTNWRSRLGTATLRSATQAILDTTLERRATDVERMRFDEIIAEGETSWRARHKPATGRHESSRAATALTVPAPDTTAFETPTDIIQRMRRLRSSDVDDGVIAVAEVALGGILDRYELEGPVRSAPQARSLRREVESLVGQCRQPEQLQRLHRLACKLSGVLAYMAVNRGAFGHATIYGQEALAIAGFLRDRNLEAWVRGTQSFCAYYQCDYTAAVEFAQEGIRRADDGSQVIRLYANGLARALGKMGDSTGVERAIDAAMSTASSVEIPSGLTPALAFVPFSEARLLANAATAYLSAGEYSKALECGQLVENQVNASDSVWSRSLVRLDVATALVRQRNRDIDHAMDLGGEALDTSRDRPIRSVWQRAHELAETVTTVKTGKVRDYVDQLREWSEQAEPVTTPEARTEVR